MNIKTLALTLLCLIPLGCEEEQQADAKAEVLRPVKTLTVSSVKQGLKRELPGVVDALKKADLSFRVSGKLEALKVNEGDVVKLGQVLAQLDKTDYKIQLQSSQASYDQAQADFKRAKELIKKNYLSSSEFDNLKAKAATASANLKATKNNLAYTTLYAPFSGLIAKRYIENFEDIGTTQPIFTLQDLSAYTVKVDVPESFMLSVSEKDASNIFATFESIPNKTFPLQFKESATQADQSTKTYEVTFTMAADRNHNILPGMTVSVLGETNQANSALPLRIFVPASAVQEDAKARFVYLAKRVSEHEGVVQRIPVTTGHLSEFGIEVLTGLNDGDSVVIAGISKMHDGLRVKLLNEE